MQNSVVCGPILAFGTDTQKRKYLRPLASGAKLGCFCLTEPQVGSDAAAIATRAEARDGHYVLTGVKQFITTGRNADTAIVFAVTDRTAGKKGISAFAVDTTLPGFRVARIEDKVGQRASDTAQIVLEDCDVPFENRLGAEGHAMPGVLRANTAAKRRPDLSPEWVKNQPPPNIGLEPTSTPAPLTGAAAPT